MATQQNFDGKIIVLPGVYSSIKSGVKNPPAALSYGNCLVIDTGSGAGAGGGAGVNGTNTNGADAEYEFDNPSDFKNFTERGIWYLLADPLFTPLTENNINAPGVSKITYIKAAATTPAAMSFAVGGDASDSAGMIGHINIQIRSEGIVGNGVKNGLNGDLSKGYAFKLVAGVMDATKVIMNFYRGSFKGLDQNGSPIGGIAEASSVAQLLLQSPEFNTTAALVAWMKTNPDFNFYFRYDATGSALPTHDVIDATTLADYVNYTLASGGTEVYSNAALQTVFEVAKKMNIDFIICDNYGANSQVQNNKDIVNFAINTQKFKPQVYIASGTLAADLSTSLADAAYYNSQQVTIVHGGAKINKSNNQGFNVYDSYYTMANDCGREAGLAPQIPLTFKNISVDGLTHTMNDTEQTKALNGGLLVIISDDGNFEFLKGVNSLQANTYLLNDDGTTHSKQFYRIAHQINKTLIIDAKKEILKNPDGTNRNTLSETDMQQWTKKKLQQLQAEPTKDNLILSFQDVLVTRQADAYFISYKFVANTEISFLFFTGTAIDIN
jgi:hypothetical protein